MTCQRFALCALLALACGAGAARADFQWQFADSTGTQQSAFTLNSVGGTVDIRVYLTATGASDIATLQNDGLVSAGVRLNYSNAGVAAVTSPSNITPNPAFDDMTAPKVATPTFSSLNAAIFTNPPVTDTSGSTTSARILIGTFTFTDINVGIITVTTADPHPGLDDTVTGSGKVLDNLIMNSAVTITAVPEPGSLALGGLAALGVAGGLWRRWRRRVAV